MVDRSKDWLDQAHRDLAQAKASLRDGFYEWACFASQQAAEKAVKGLIQSRGGESWGRSVADLIDALPEDIRPVNLRENALELDQAYIPSRYPNAHPASHPGKTFTKPMAERLIKYAGDIVSYCQVKINEGHDRRTKTNGLESASER